MSYPDFAQLSYYEYQSNDRVFREIFCVGVGQYTISDVKVGDDLLTDRSSINDSLSTIV